MGMEGELALPLCLSSSRLLPAPLLLHPQAELHTQQNCTSFHHPWLVASTEHSHFQGPCSASVPTFPRNLGQGPQGWYQEPFEKCTHWPVSNLNTAPTQGLRDLIFSYFKLKSQPSRDLVTSSWTWGHGGNFPFCLKVSVPVQTQQLPCSIISERWFPD